jgi:hypothetical protein
MASKMIFYSNNYYYLKSNRELVSSISMNACVLMYALTYLHTHTHGNIPHSKTNLKCLDRSKSSNPTVNLGTFHAICLLGVWIWWNMPMLEPRSTVTAVYLGEQSLASELCGCKTRGRESDRTGFCPGRHRGDVLLCFLRYLLISD